MHPKDGSTSSEGVVGRINNMFCFAALTDKEKNTIYTDATGALPFVSLDGKQYYIATYGYGNTYVYALPVSDLKDKTIVAAVKEFEQDMDGKVHKTRLNVTDNQAVGSVKCF